MTQMLDRPTTDVEFHSLVETIERPTEVEKEEIRQLPPPEKPRRLFRWLGWLLGLAVIAVLSWIVIAEITSDEPVASPTYEVTQPGAIITDPKVRTPAVTSEMVNESIRTGIPGSATLTDVSMLGNTPAVSLEDATVNPMIYWAVQPTYATMMEEATVSPAIYEAAAIPPNWSLETYDLISTYQPASPSALSGAYWRHDLILEERPLLPEGLDLTFGIWPAMYAEPATNVAPATDLPGTLWMVDLVPEVRPMFPEGLDLTFGIWPAMYAEPALSTPVPTPVHGGHMNIMR